MVTAARATAAARPSVSLPPPARPGYGEQARRLAATRIVAVWVAAAATVAAGCVGYLAMLVHVMALGRTLASLEQQLEQERRRAELLDVALAQALSPEITEDRARELWAMGRPQQVQVVVVEPSAVGDGGFSEAVAPAAPAAAGEGWLLTAGADDLGRVSAGDSGGRAQGLWARTRAAVQEWMARPLALARRLPRWP